jgi:hypothetical protein
LGPFAGGLHYPRDWLQQHGPGRLPGDRPGPHLLENNQVPGGHPTPRRIERSAGGPESLAAAADLLAEAKFPVILDGGGINMGGGQAATIELAELLKAPVCNTYLHNDSFPSDHELWMGPLGYQDSKAAMKTIAQADVVLALGTRLGPFGTLPQHGIDYWPKDAKIIQVDVNHRILGLVKDIDVAVLGDAGKAVAGLIDRLLKPLLHSADEAAANLPATRAVDPGGVLVNGDFIKPVGTTFEYEPGRFPVARHLELLADAGFSDPQCLALFETNIEDTTAGQNYACLVALR